MILRPFGHQVRLLDANQFAYRNTDCYQPSDLAFLEGEQMPRPVTNQLFSQVTTTKPEIFAERGLIVTRSYAETEGKPYETRQARAFATVLQQYPVVIRDGELIVGSKTVNPFGSPIYPEVSFEWLQDELDTLATRREQPFYVSEQTKRQLREQVFPYWRGKTVYAKLLEALPRQALEAHEAGVLFHYYLDRSIGHIVVDYETVLKRGFNDIRREIERELKSITSQERASERKAHLLEAAAICIDATTTFARRYAAEARRLAAAELDPERRNELVEIARICESVPAEPARTFWEALQSFFFVHLVLNLESNSYAISPGRFDQYMYPYYRADLDQGRIKKDFGMELLRCLWIKLNELTVVKSAGTAKQSTTYNDFQNLNVGGYTPDGDDAVNELSYLLLDVAAELHMPQPNLTALICEKTPHDFLLKSVSVIRLGLGQPALINDDVKVLVLLGKGVPLRDARSAAINGCVEISIPGKHHMASGGYLNLAKCLELALNNGKDPLSRKQLGPTTGDPTGFETFDDLLKAFHGQLEMFIELKVTYDNIARQIYGTYYPVPFTSMLMQDCLRRGLNFHDYGAVYNTPLICPVGIATCADSLAAIKKLVFEDQKVSMRELIQALHNNYIGREGEYLRQLLLNTAPKFGNDDDYVDDIAKDLVSTVCEILRKHHNAVGSSYAPNIIPTTTHLHFGSLTGATPDGRKSGNPLSEGVSPAQGRDMYGPTCVARSVVKLPLSRCYGALLNQKFNPTVLSGTDGIEKFASLWRTYFQLGGYHAQFNIISAETLREAQRNPEAHRNLIIRVAGYSDYFVRLNKDVQDEIIARTEHGSS